MNRNENSAHFNTKGTQKDGPIESSFEKLLKWREHERIRVLNIAEQCGSHGKEELQFDNENTKRKITNRRQECTIKTIKQ